MVALTVITYAHALNAGFVFDSRFLVLQDQRVHRWSAENLGLIFQQSYWWPSGESGLFRPVTTLSILLNYLIARDNAAVYHAINLGLHIINVLLVFLVCRSITSHPTTALVTSALWAVIPIGTEVVANIAGRADLLSSTFVLAGFLCYTRTLATRPNTRWLLALSMCLTLGIFSKESAIVLIPMVLAHAVLLRKRTTATTLVPLLCALAGPVVLLFAARWFLLGQLLSPRVPFVDNPIAYATWPEGRLTAFRVLGDYLRLFVWPQPLLADYSYPQIRLATGTVVDIAGWVALFLAIALAAYFRRNFDVSMGFLIAFFGILPVSNLLFPIGTVMAERLMYLPSVGLCLSCVAMARAASTTALTRNLSLLVLACVILGWSSRAYARVDDWQSDLTLWQSAKRHDTHSAKAHRALAEALYDSDPSRNNLESVIAYARRATELLDGLPLSLRSHQEYRQLAAYDLDRAYRVTDSGQKQMFYAEAQRAATTAIDILRQHPERDGLSVRASSADLYRIRATANTRLGRYLDGAQDAQSAIQLDPFSEQAHLLAADAWLALKDPDSAAQQLAMGAMVLQSARLSEELIKLYRAVAPQGCALRVIGGVTTVNPQCPVVRTHLCAAAVKAGRLLHGVGRAEQAKELEVRSRQNFGCSEA